MTKPLLFILLLFSLPFSTQVLSETQKLESLCRIWGFLKYYHPQVANGSLDWDGQLFKKISELKSIEDKADLNRLYSDWIDDLGKIDQCKDCSGTDQKIYFLKNFDLSWIDDSDLLNNKVSRKLRYIEDNRHVGAHHYFGISGRKIYFRNENPYGYKFSSKEIALLELFRYWNYVEYFFPYKYQTDQKWNDVLSEMIPKFMVINNDETYHLSLAELVAKTDDSHAYLNSPHITKSLYGNRRLPAEYLYAEGKLVITKTLRNRLHEKSALKTGDVIYDINGKTISQIINGLGKYIPASNSWGKVNKLKAKLLFTNNDSISVKVERDGQNIEIKARTYLAKDIISKKIPASSKWKFIDGGKKIGYVNMGSIEKEDLDAMYKELKSTESIIFDLRNYPRQTIVPLSRLLLPAPTVYYQFIFPAPEYPGRFYSRKNSIGRKNPEYYKGNVIVLVNENTQSQAETTVMMLKQHPKSKVIGSHTSGANGDVISFKLAGLDTRFTGLGAYYPEGKETQRIGIIPDILVKPTVEGIKAERDELLERALDYIHTGN
ncbi:S41 family peptidase [Chryseobacterium pennipullorum]|uniref:Tail specific protease domain-containing protein n=1 Tax=Chryseobacterium pennipullorum TaxID=2258963 RepID=A0A3D9B7B9_9FLAO|nr:S41 family peptidase [Chryseobacterium pennipullorum]REC49585.1 hypothetical protein DRF67_03715 [Chryseobacterium pennipullorum]